MLTVAEKIGAGGGGGGVVVVGQETSTCLHSRKSLHK